MRYTESVARVKLSEWARENGVDRHTASRWFYAGILPVPAVRLPTGTILVEDAPKPVSVESVALYARVSSSDQRGDLDRQLSRLSQYAAENRLPVSAVVKEVGSAMNSKRPKLLHLLCESGVSTIVVEHRDRLMRFGFEALEAALSAQGRRILVIEDRELDDDLVRDMTEVLTSFCARLYGRRSAKRRAKKALQAAGEA